MCLPGRVLITRCWSGNLSVVSSSARLPWLAGPGRASCRHGGVLLWRFTFAPSVRPFLCLPISVSLLLSPAASLSLCPRGGRYWSYSLLLPPLLLLLLLARLPLVRADRIVTLFCLCPLLSRRHPAPACCIMDSEISAHPHDSMFVLKLTVELYYLLIYVFHHLPHDCWLVSSTEISKESLFTEKC